MHCCLTLPKYSSPSWLPSLLFSEQRLLSRAAPMGRACSCHRMVPRQPGLPASAQPAGQLAHPPGPSAQPGFGKRRVQKNKIKIDLSVATWLAELPHPILKLLNIYIFNSMHKNKQAPGVTNSHAAVPDCPSRCSQHPVPPAPQPGCSRTQPGTVARTRAHPRPLPRAVQHQPLAATPGTDTSCCPSTKYRLVRAHPHPYRHRDEHLQGSPSHLNERRY